MMNRMLLRFCLCTHDNERPNQTREKISARCGARRGGEVARGATTIVGCARKEKEGPCDADQPPQNR